MPLVLVHNDVVRNPEHAWDDVEGVRYHYPAKYQSIITTGEPFVYYRGVHRVAGPRGPAEYIGAGRIGAIWLDANRPTGRRKAWYCAIDDFRRFETPVPARQNGENLEDIPRNKWRDGVRQLDPAVFARIVGVAAEPSAKRPPPAAHSTRPVAVDSLIVPRGPTGGEPRRRSNYRISRQAKTVGDWAEQVAMRFIASEVAGCADCVHRAAVGETPGWDIDYRDAAGVLQRVEVKGTVAGGFTSVDLTVNELRAAREHRKSYWLYLVANCLTDSPRVQTIRDPNGFLKSGAWTASPTLFSLRF